MHLSQPWCVFQCRPWKFTASLLEMLLWGSFRICVRVWEMVSNMSMKGSLKPLFWKADLAWLSQGGVRVLGWWCKWQGIGFVQGSCSPGVRGTPANGGDAGLPGMRTICTGFSTIVPIALKIIKYVQKTSDIWIHKSTVIVSFCEGN